MSAGLSDRVHLANDRLPKADADRQERTAAEILRRLDSQPGIILADEVGMGKTFVALAVAYSVIEASDFKTQVVVMVPNSVRHKWPREWTVFRERCLPEGSPVRASRESVSDAVSFLKKLDDPHATRDHVVFATHNALTGQLQDPFVRLAILGRVLRRPSLELQRKAFPRFARRVLRDRRFEDQDLVQTLLSKSPLFWRKSCEPFLKEPLDDDPVPEAVLQVMDKLRFDELARVLQNLPLRESANIDERLTDVRRAISREIAGLWRSSLESLDFELPLLIVDEAHHLKNPDTQFAGIFTAVRDDAGLEQRGALNGVFRNMLFLTATPFQLGHAELVEILRRFESVRWTSAEALAAYRSEIDRVESALGHAQLDGLLLDQAWGRIRPEDLNGHGERAWWADVERDTLPERLQRAADAIDRAQGSIQASESLLRPWVIRHGRKDRDRRRRLFTGRSILDENSELRSGLPIAGDAVFPFLLAARAQAIVAEGVRRDGHRAQALFALGLASSFEAYRDTRRRKLEEFRDRDEGEPVAGEPAASSAEIDWYLDQIYSALDDGDRDRWRAHPKIDASIRRAVELWERGEKLVLFCWFVATGRALRRHLSRALESRLIERGAASLGLDPADGERALLELQRISENRFEPGAPLRRSVETLVGQTLLESKVPAAWLEPDPSLGREGLLDLVIRFLRTPSFLVRYFDLDPDSDLASAFEASYATTAFGELTLEEQLRRFGRFLVDRTEDERSDFLRALGSVQTGRIGERPVDDDEESERSVLLPNVRLVNGKSRPETRRTLLLAFNTPFFPEILVASSVMAEGVDLHLACRHVIHHDLDWNPSVLEQRTGRLDRIGGKSEVVGKPVHVFEPFVEATQDEKMFRVVKDRERWFNVVMGQGIRLDEHSTDAAAERVAFPEELSQTLSMRLNLADS